MKINFTTPMTFYELLAIIMAGIAIIIPLLQAAWKKWGIRAKLNFMPIGRAVLFFNQSGSYIRIDGVCEAENKPISIKQITANITRLKDERKLKLSWSCFISPVNQSMLGNYLQTTEAAHPFRIEANSIANAFIEFGDLFDSFGKTFKTYMEPLVEKISYIQIYAQNYNEAVVQYKNLPEYNHAKKMLEKEFFWDIGKYNIEITATYANKEVLFPFEITVGEYEHSYLVQNIEEALLSPLKQAYRVQWNYHTTFVELHSK